MEEGIVFFRDFKIPADGGGTDRATVFEQLLVFRRTLLDSAAATQTVGGNTGGWQQLTNFLPFLIDVAFITS